MRVVSNKSYASRISLPEKADFIKIDDSGRYIYRGQSGLWYVMTKLCNGWNVMQVESSTCPCGM
jgi:hypothetical protein